MFKERLIGFGNLVFIESKERHLTLSGRHLYGYELLVRLWRATFLVPLKVCHESYCYILALFRPKSKLLKHNRTREHIAQAHTHIQRYMNNA
jgi:hypothetical protein